MVFRYWMDFKRNAGFVNMITSYYREKSQSA
jgi:hypothetical protein